MVDDVPGSLSDGTSYFYRVEEYGGPAPTIRLERKPGDDSVRIRIEP